MRRRRPSLVLPPLMLAALACLGAGLHMPIMTAEKWLIVKESYSVLDAVALLLRSGDLLVAGIVVAFAVAFPAAKLLALLAAWGWMRAGRRLPSPALPLLEVVGRWSMLDVFAVALVVTAAKVRSFVDASVGPAASLLVLAFLLTAVCTWALKRHARDREDEARPPGGSASTS
jgi:paraquat-inducible protein A